MIKRALLVAALVAATTVALADPPQLPLPWAEVSPGLFVTTGPAKLYGAGDGTKPPPYNAVYVMTHLAVPYGPQEQNVFHRADFKPFGVAANARVAFLAGPLIVTHGWAAEEAYMHVVFRAPGDTTTTCDDIMGQVVSVSGGERSMFASWVPLVNGETEFCYGLSTIGSDPLHSAYGINLSIQAWAR